MEQWIISPTQSAVKLLLPSIHLSYIYIFWQAARRELRKVPGQASSTSSRRLHVKPGRPGTTCWQVDRRASETETCHQRAADSKSYYDESGESDRLRQQRWGRDGRRSSGGVQASSAFAFLLLSSCRDSSSEERHLFLSLVLLAPDGSPKSSRWNCATMQVMLSHPVPSPEVSGARQASNSCAQMIFTQSYVRVQKSYKLKMCAQHLGIKFF